MAAVTTVSGCTVKNPELARSLTLYNSWRGTERPQGDRTFISSGWCQNVAWQMATNTTNAVGLNFYQRLHKHLKGQFVNDGHRAYKTLAAILDTTYEGDDAQVLEWCARIPRSEIGKLNSRPHMLLPLTYMFLADIEERNRMNQATPGYVEACSFSLLPYKRRFECSHFAMCTDGLWALFRQAQIPISKKGPAWRAVSDAWWCELFNINKFETANRRFSGQIKTDGVVVSIVMRRPKRILGPRKLKIEEYDVLRGFNLG